MAFKEKVVDSFGPFDLIHRTVGSHRYWRVTHRPTGLHAVSFDSAPCTGHVKAVREKFNQLTADWPSMEGFDAANMQPPEIERLKTLRDMFKLVSPWEFRLVALQSQPIG